MLKIGIWDDWKFLNMSEVDVILCEGIWKSL